MFTTEIKFHCSRCSYMKKVTEQEKAEMKYCPSCGMALGNYPDRPDYFKDLWKQPIKSPIWPDIDYTPRFGNKESICDRCPNNKHDGSVRVCHCTLPYLNGEGPTW